MYPRHGTVAGCPQNNHIIRERQKGAGAPAGGRQWLAVAIAPGSCDVISPVVAGVRVRVTCSSAPRRAEPGTDTGGDRSRGSGLQDTAPKRDGEVIRQAREGGGRAGCLGGVVLAWHGDRTGWVGRHGDRTGKVGRHGDRTGWVGRHGDRTGWVGRQGDRTGPVEARSRRQADKMAGKQPP